jgi:hypothetical protein
MTRRLARALAVILLRPPCAVWMQLRTRAPSCIFLTCWRTTKPRRRSWSGSTRTRAARGCCSSTARWGTPPLSKRRGRRRIPAASASLRCIRRSRARGGNMARSSAPTRVGSWRESGYLWLGQPGPGLSARRGAACQARAGARLGRARPHAMCHVLGELSAPCAWPT